LLANPFGGANRFPIQTLVPLADISQSPIHRFSYEISLIVRFPLNDCQQSPKLSV